MLIPAWIVSGELTLALTGTQDLSMYPDWLASRLAGETGVRHAMVEVEGLQGKLDLVIKDELAQTLFSILN